MSHLPPELIRSQILVRLNVTDLIRCKSVCKSLEWMISDPQFIKSHINHNCQIDLNNDEIGHRRIIMSQFSHYYLYEAYDVDDRYVDSDDCLLLGSCNGLVCVSPSRTKILVVNPSTREVKKLTKPQIPESGSLCWGFGYDASTDDYKVVLGYEKDETCTCFQVFSLRHNSWKVMGEINCAFISRFGVLCNQALHWATYDVSSEKEMIHSFHLSEEKFQEVPQPHDVIYQSNVSLDTSMSLGTMNGCLCILQQQQGPSSNLWVMKDYNVKESWEIFGREREIKNDVVHCIKRLRNYIPNKRPLCHETSLLQRRRLVLAPLYVESLESPHFHKRQERNGQATNTLRSDTKVKLNNNHIVACQNHVDASANANANDSASASTNTNTNTSTSTSTSSTSTDTSTSASARASASASVY